MIGDIRYTITKAVLKSYDGEKYVSIRQNSKFYTCKYTIVDMDEVFQDETINLAEAHVLNYTISLKEVVSSVKIDFFLLIFAAH